MIQKTGLGLLMALFVLTACREGGLLDVLQQPTEPPSVVQHNDEWEPVIQEIDGVEMVLVPPGCFMMGNPDCKNCEIPAHEICFDDSFWIDRYEVTNGQFANWDGQARSQSRFSGDDRPRENISWDEAVNFCAARDARLPTEAEWEYAARGPDSLLYPWGNEFVADNVVYSLNADHETADVGSRPDGASWVGAMDMSGNVEEWVHSRDMAYPYNADDGRENAGGLEPRVMRGGAWRFSPEERFLSFYRTSYDIDLRDYGLGFRCAR